MQTVSNDDFHIKVSNDNGTATIHLNGNFNFWSYLQFNRTCLPIINDQIVNSVAIDFASVDRLDSSALGMLLILRERLLPSGKTLTLLSPNPMVKRVFDIANFHRQFTIHYSKLGEN